MQTRKIRVTGGDAWILAYRAAVGGQPLVGDLMNAGVDGRSLGDASGWGCLYVFRQAARGVLGSRKVLSRSIATAHW
ncbi:hypothetical protein ACFVFT_22225 [Streptomyces tendae]|uniref:hypothetical protein n=1 Tax=Streptomyces tendae TaxID=1932 RepID=UPI0036A2E952